MLLLHLLLVLAAAEGNSGLCSQHKHACCCMCSCCLILPLAAFLCWAVVAASPCSPAVVAAALVFLFRQYCVEKHKLLLCFSFLRAESSEQRKQRGQQQQEKVLPACNFWLPRTCRTRHSPATSTGSSNGRSLQRAGGSALALLPLLRRTALSVARQA